MPTIYHAIGPGLNVIGEFREQMIGIAGDAWSMHVNDGTPRVPFSVYQTVSKHPDLTSTIEAHRKGTTWRDQNTYYLIWRNGRVV